jgi:hypothetical protein
MKAVLNFLRHFYDSALRKEKRDWEVVFYCILVSALFWILNAMGKSYHHTLEIPVKYKYDSRSCVPLASLPEFVEIKAEGRGWELLRASLSRNPSSLEVAIPRPLSTLQLIPQSWEPEIRAMIPYIKLEQILTDSIFCRFDPIESRDIRLFADLQDFHLKSGYRITSPIKITPSTVRFTGAASLVRALPPQLPVKISGNDAQESIDQNFNLDFQEEFPQSELLRYQTETVNIHFNIRSALEDEREIPVQIVNSNLQPALFLKEEKVLVSYLVSIPDREKVLASDFRLVADMSSFNPADSTISLKLEKWSPLISDAKPGSRKIRVYGR